VKTQAAPFDRDSPDPLTSHELVAGVRKHLPTIAIVTLIATGAAVFLSFSQPERYTSTASVVLETTASSAPATQVNMATEKQIASSRAVANDVIRNLHLNATPDEVLSGLSVTVPVDTEVLLFSYSSTYPEEAQHRAQAFVDAYRSYRHEELLQAFNDSNQEILARIDQLRSTMRSVTAKAASTTDPGKRAALQASANALLAQIGVQEEQIATGARILSTTGQLLAGASLPTSPAGPRAVVNVILGLFVGVVLGTFAALGKTAFAWRVHNERDVEQAVGAPVLAVIPRPRRSKESPLIVVTEPRSPAADAYRRLIVRLLASPNGHGPLRRVTRTIAVVGLDERADTATVVANLGAAMALSGRTVLLTFAGSDGSGLETIFGIHPGPGINDVIRRDAPLRDAIQSTMIESLGIAPAGSDAGGWALLDTEAVRFAMDEMISRVEVVLVDAPARAAAEASALVAACDAVMLVGSLHSTSLEDARRVRSELDLLGTSSLGIVMFERRLLRARDLLPEMSPTSELAEIGDAPSAEVAREPSSA
jgi:capsular polysaccharide biosynthesis protein